MDQENASSTTERESAEIPLDRVSHMKLISLNTWGGKYFEPLISFLKHNSTHTDIFCFQEVYHTTSDVKQYKTILRANLLDEIRNVLPDFQFFFFNTIEGFDDEANPVAFDLYHGPVIFIKNSININSHKDYFIYKQDPQKPPEKDFSNLPTPLQFLNFSLGNRDFSIFNFHGTPFPANKLDSENRMDQSNKVREIMNSKKGSKIIVGDFNLLPQTESLNIIEKGMRNLIKEFNIKRTRSNLSTFFGKKGFQKFADYAFVSKINVLKFEVLEIEISDHLPLILEFS